MHAMYNTQSHALWIDRGDGTTAHIGYPMDRMAALGYIGMAKLIRYGDWLPAYGPVVKCAVSEVIR